MRALPQAFTPSAASWQDIRAQLSEPRCAALMIKPAPTPAVHFPR